MAEFKVGDKALLHGRTVEVSYGPFTSPLGYDWLIVRRPDGREETARKSDLKPVPPAFAVGDTVTLSTTGSRATVEYGPFDDRDVYVVKLVDEPTDGNPRTFTTLAGVMEKVPALVPVGTRVRVDRAAHAEQCHGKVGVVTSNTGTFRRGLGDTHAYTVDEPDDDDAWTYEGVTYAPGVDYVDKDGDFWRFEVIDGVLHGDWGQGRYSVSPYTDNIPEAVRSYGPFTKQ